MTTLFGRLRSDIGFMAGLPSYDVPLIDRLPPQSLWAKRTRTRSKNAIDVQEALTFNTENVDSIKDRIVEENIRKVPYGQNRGAGGLPIMEEMNPNLLVSGAHLAEKAGMSHSAIMAPSLLGNNAWYSTHAQNPRRAFRHSFFRPVVKSSFDVYRPIGKAPERGIVVEGRINRDTTVVTDMLPDPSTIVGLEPTLAVTAEGKPSSTAVQPTTTTESTPLSFTPKVVSHQKDLQRIGRNSYWETIRPSVHPTAVFRGTMETPTPSIAPKLKDVLEIEPITAGSDFTVIGSSAGEVIPFNPDYIIREVEPVTVHANPVMNIVDFIDVIDVKNGRTTQMRQTLPKILGQRFQVKVYDNDSGNYFPVHEKYNPQIMASTKMGSGISVPVEGSDKTIKLKDYRMIAYTSQAHIPVLVLEPWVTPPKARDQMIVQVSSHMGSSNAETTDLFLPAFREKNAVQISQPSEAVLPKQANLGLSAKPKPVAVPVGNRGDYFDRVVLPTSIAEKPQRPIASFRKKEPYAYM
jgi:hypothetical protein